jgi:ketosteroid isomerase-like protein
MLRRLLPVLFLLPLPIHAQADSRSSEDQQLIATESSFYEASVARKGDGWGDFAAEDAVTSAAIGRAKIVEAMNRFYENSTLEWHATYAHVFENVGVTSGPYVLHGKKADGTPTTLEGHYVTVWRHTAAGWKFVWDGDAKERLPHQSR